MASARASGKLAEARIREAKPTDVSAAADLVLRLKRLNGEFDPWFEAAEGAQAYAEEYLRKAVASDEHMVLVAEQADKVVGVVKADLRDRRFYRPRREGAIIEFYVLPEYRRRKLGRRMIEATMKALKARGAELVTAEFPSRNMIAVEFYEELGFRGLVSRYAAALT